MEAIASWVAPIATMIAAMMTAANLGARITGWGFVVFLIGSIGWSIVGVSTGQQNLLLTNGFLTIVNGIGIWRWLGRQARYEDGGAAAARHSAEIARVPTLFAFGSVAGTRLHGRDGKVIGVVIEGMMRCADSSLAYVVVSEGGLGGVGERLHALAPEAVRFSEGKARCALNAAELAALPVLPEDDWPAAIDAT